MVKNKCAVGILKCSVTRVSTVVTIWLIGYFSDSDQWVWKLFPTVKNMLITPIPESSLMITVRHYHPIDYQRVSRR